MRRKWILLLGAFLFLAISGGVVWVWLRERQAAKNAQQVQSTPQGPTPGSEVSFSGTISGKHIVEVPASIDGILEQFHTEIGQEVTEGQLLAVIRSTQLESERDRAKMELENAQTRVTSLESNIIQARLEASRAAAEATRARLELDRLQRQYDRQRLLLKEGATPRLVYEKIEKEYLAAKAEYESARDISANADQRVSSLSRQLEAAKRTLEEKTDDLETATAALAAGEVHSPVDGIVVARRGEPGAEVTRDWKDFIQIATDLGDLRVTIEPEPPVLARLQIGQPALIFITEAGNEPLSGTVTEIKDTKVIIDFRSPTPDVKPGMTAQVRLKILPQNASLGSAAEAAAQRNEK